MPVRRIIAALAMLCAAQAHAAETWDHRDDGQAWGQQQPGRTTTYHPYQRQDGTIGRCAVWQWRGEPVMRCD
jgi:hypothetical protein